MCLPPAAREAAGERKPKEAGGVPPRALKTSPMAAKRSNTRPHRNFLETCYLGVSPLFLCRLFCRFAFASTSRHCEEERQSNLGKPHPANNARSQSCPAAAMSSPRWPVCWHGIYGCVIACPKPSSDGFFVGVFCRDVEALRLYFFVVHSAVSRHYEETRRMPSTSYYHIVSHTSLREF